MNHYRLIDVRFVDLTGDSDGGCDYTISVLHSDHPLVRFYDESELKDGIWIKGYYGREEFQNHMDSVEEPEERDDYDAIMSLSNQQQDLYWEIANGVERGRITTELALLAGSVIVLDPNPPIIFETYYMSPCVNFDLALAISKLSDDVVGALLHDFGQYTKDKDCIINNGARSPYFLPHF